MITGYETGTKVKWDDEGTIATGTVVRVFREPAWFDMDGEMVQVQIQEDNPVYLIRDYNGKYMLLPHNDIFLKDMNHHT